MGKISQRKAWAVRRPKLVEMPIKVCSALKDAGNTFFADKIRSQAATAPQTGKRAKMILPERPVKNKAMVQGLVLEPKGLKQQNLRRRRDSLTFVSHGGVVEGIRLAVTSIGSLILGLRISSTVVPASTFVMPMTGGSPFLTNS